jgi:hypothetical protein
VTFGECNLEVGEAPRDDDSSNAWTISESHDSSKESRPSSPAASSDSSDALTTTSSSGGTSLGSRWKSSRIIAEASAVSLDDKTTLR